MVHGVTTEEPSERGGTNTLLLRCIGQSLNMLALRSAWGEGGGLCTSGTTFTGYEAGPFPPSRRSPGWLALNEVYSHQEESFKKPLCLL